MISGRGRTKWGNLVTTAFKISIWMCLRLGCSGMVVWWWEHVNNGLVTQNLHLLNLMNARLVSGVVYIILSIMTTCVPIKRTCVHIRKYVLCFNCTMTSIDQNIGIVPPDIMVTLWLWYLRSRLKSSDWSYKLTVLFVWKLHSLRNHSVNYSGCWAHLGFAWSLSEGSISLPPNCSLMLLALYRVSVACLEQWLSTGDPKMAHGSVLKRSAEKKTMLNTTNKMHVTMLSTFMRKKCQIKLQYFPMNSFVT